MKINKVALIAAILFCCASHADCIKNNLGKVYCGTGQCQINNLGQIFCSSYKGGGAELDNIGQVKCGKGKCGKNTIGEVYCAKTEGAAAILNAIGSIECLGGCEEASEQRCERIEE